ncbi:hypothetical protein PInf_004775 [Phytophthora infestans]|nr:hypothetical protein PInf_004775 [Phytophthora infestans]
MFVLSEYVSKFNHLHPRRKSTVLKTSTKGFGGESNLVTLLDTAKRDALTEVKAMEFETQLLQQWQDENLDPASAMKLRLDSNAYNILKSPNLRTLKKYLQNAQFRERIDNDIDPKNVLTSVFNVEEADALRNQIRVVRAYEAYFKKKNNAAPHKVDPRRS